MAIALDSQGKSTVASAAFNNVAGNCLVVFAYGTISGVTYNSVSMVQVQTATSGTGRQTMSAWILSSPATGSNTLAASGTFTEWFALSYSGCLTTGQPDSSNLVTGTVNGPITASTTVVAANCWLVMGTADATGGETAGTGITFRQTDSGNGLVSGDSNGTVGTGSQSMTVTVGATSSWAAIIMSIAPSASAAVTGTRPFFTLLGVS